MKMALGAMLTVNSYVRRAQKRWMSPFLRTWRDADGKQLRSASAEKVDVTFSANFPFLRTHGNETGPTPVFAPSAKRGIREHRVIGRDRRAFAAAGKRDGNAVSFWKSENSGQTIFAMIKSSKALRQTFPGRRRMRHSARYGQRRCAEVLWQSGFEITSIERRCMRVARFAQRLVYSLNIELSGGA
jgi:hypothetical protein